MNALAEAPVDTDSMVDVQPKHSAGMPPSVAVRETVDGADRPS